MPKAGAGGARTTSAASHAGSPLWIQTERTPVDYVYRRCYVDRQGNTIDPRTFWDELLKYYKHNKSVLISEGAKLSKPVAAVASQEIAAERRRVASRRRIEALEADYLEEKVVTRKQRKRKKKSRSEMNA
jgi:hypothetical protein